MSAVPKRKSNRLKGYDYSSTGAYFVTLCSYNRKQIFSRIVGASHESPEWVYDLSESDLYSFGKILEEIICEIPGRFEVEITDYIIMPNHVHMVIMIDEKRAIRESPLQKRSLVSKIVGYLKANTSKEIHKRYPDMKVWQRDYFDHVIRNDKEYQMISEYIYTNPGKWTEDRFFN